MIIAEAGINHQGIINNAINLIKKAYESGADAIKFQHYIPEILCVNRGNFDAYNVLSKNKMHEWWIPILKKECDKLRIRFLCTPFCKFTAESLNPYVDSFKIASPEVCDIEFVKHVASYGKPLILSTGKATYDILDKIFSQIDNEIVLLYCVSKYPAGINDIDLSEMDRLRKRYKVKVGYSDHSKGIKKAIESVEKGAFIVEKHFCIDKNCVDSEVSLTPHEFKKMSELIRRTYGER